MLFFPRLKVDKDKCPIPILFSALANVPVAVVPMSKLLENSTLFLPVFTSNNSSRCVAAIVSIVPVFDNVILEPAVKDICF